jgi:OOP family OmpA-OmpF porin
MEAAMRPILLIAAFALAAKPLLAKPLVEFPVEEKKGGKGDDRVLNDPEISLVQEEIDSLMERVRRKEIPPIEFELDSAELKPTSRPTLRLVAELLESHKHVKLMVFGHTCNLGSREYNRDLSKRRAEAVKDALIELGVLGEFVKANGMGMDKPVASNDTEEGRAKNRRVEFVVTNRWWESVY